MGREFQSETACEAWAPLWAEWMIPPDSGTDLKNKARILRAFASGTAAMPPIERGYLGWSLSGFCVELGCDCAGCMLLG